MRILRLVLIGAFIQCLFITEAYAGKDRNKGKDSEKDKGRDKDKGHEMHHNHIAVFGGLTQINRENGLSLGIDYERRLSKRCGVIAFAEQTYTKEATLTIFGGGLAYHAGKHWKAILGVGLESEQEKAEAEGEAEGGAGAEGEGAAELSGFALAGEEEGGAKKGGSHVLFRIGIGYEFHVGAISVVPTFNIDVVEGKFIDIIGVSAGIGF